MLPYVASVFGTALHLSYTYVCTYSNLIHLKQKSTYDLDTVLFSWEVSTKW